MRGKEHSLLMKWTIFTGCSTFTQSALQFAIVHTVVAASYHARYWPNKDHLTCGQKEAGDQTTSQLLDGSLDLLSHRGILVGIY